MNLILINLFAAGVLCYALWEIWKRDDDIETLIGQIETKNLWQISYLRHTAEIAELKKTNASIRGQITKLKKKAGSL